jgi:hypothetical protein
VSELVKAFVVVVAAAAPAYCRRVKAGIRGYLTLSYGSHNDGTGSVPVPSVMVVG